MYWLLREKHENSPMSYQLHDNMNGVRCEWWCECTYLQLLISWHVDVITHIGNVYVILQNGNWSLLRSKCKNTSRCISAFCIMGPLSENPSVISTSASQKSSNAKLILLLAGGNTQLTMELLALWHCLTCACDVTGIVKSLLYKNAIVTRVI